MSEVPFQFRFDVSSGRDSSSALNDDAEATSNHQTDQVALDTSCAIQQGEDACIKPFTLIPNVRQLLAEKSREQIEFETVQLATGDDAVVLPMKRVLLRQASLTTTPSPIVQPESSRAATPQTTADEAQSMKSDLEEQHTDLVTRVYEGGLKVWECSIDLCRYLALHWQECFPSTIKSNAAVLELGCGHALPGCLLLREGMQQQDGVDFFVLLTDYNDFVLRDVTTANLVLNVTSLRESSISKDVLAERVLLGAGDWMDMSRRLRCGEVQSEATWLPLDGRFDLILAAETTYTVESARASAELLAKHLKFDSGVGLVATKRYYFGVGGGSDAFRMAASSQNASDDDKLQHQLKVDTIKVYDSGVGNIRELLRISLVRSPNDGNRTTGNRKEKRM